MTQGNSYFPEKETSDQVNLLVDEDAVLVQEEPPKKKCPFAKPGKKLALFSISAFVLYHLFGYCADYVPTFDEAGEYVSSMASEYEHGNCNPTIPLNLNKTFEFDPNEYPSFGLAVFGNSKHNSVTFVRNDYDKITFEPEIFISSIKAADNVHVGTHTKDERFGFGIKGPSWFKGHKECFKANIVVNIPKNLEGLDRMWIRLPSGHISSDFGGDLALKKLHFELGAGDIKLEGKTINEIELTTGCGNIEISDSTSEKVSLYARKGDIAAKDISSSKTVGATADGNVHLEIKNAKEAVAKNINGPSTLKVVSLAPVANSKGGYTFVAGSVNGDTKLSVPEVYKGRFAARTFNGEAKVETSGDEEDLHFSKNYRSHKAGHKGENADSASYAEAATFNGSPKLEFY